jgi:hypothetical protein
LADTHLSLKYECRSETAVQLKERYPKASGSFSRVLIADLLNELHAELDADTLPDHSIHCG